MKVNICVDCLFLFVPRQERLVTVRSVALVTDCTQLSIWVERWDAEEQETVKNTNAEQVRVMWRMGRGKRSQVWCRLGRFQELEELELGGEYECECLVDAEELLMLLAEGEDALAVLYNLSLWYCESKVDDVFLRALASTAAVASSSSSPAASIVTPAPPSPVSSVLLLNTKKVHLFHHYFLFSLILHAAL